jgi:hypothetical protein
MGTKEIIKELELNYGYKFNPKEKHEFDWICDIIKDVETVVSKNESLHLVVESPQEAFDRGYTAGLNVGKKLAE